MSVKLTPRMASWISTFGLHIATANKTGWPVVIVADTVIAGETYLSVPLSPSQKKLIEANIAENPQAALAPGHLGSVRAPYQFKGRAKITGERLEISIDEIYCTKPGAEAGIRLDTLGYDRMLAYEESRWTDPAPQLS